MPRLSRKRLAARARAIHNLHGRKKRKTDDSSGLELDQIELIEASYDMPSDHFSPFITEVKTEYIDDSLVVHFDFAIFRVTVVDNSFKFRMPRKKRQVRNLKRARAIHELRKSVEKKQKTEVDPSNDLDETIITEIKCEYIDEGHSLGVSLRLPKISENFWTSYNSIRSKAPDYSEEIDHFVQSLQLPKCFETKSMHIRAKIRQVLCDARDGHTEQR